MPEMDGIEFVKNARKLINESGVPQPFMICCTSYDTTEHRDIAIGAGFDQFIVKPPSSMTLKEIVAGL